MPIIVTWQTPACQQKAENLARDLGLRLVSDPDLDLADRQAYQLEVTEQNLQLKKGKSRLFVDFVQGPVAYRRQFGGGLKESIAKAIGLKSLKNPVTVLDLTAGLGEDAFILAALGCSVRLIERSPVIAALLQDGLTRAAHHPITRPIVERMSMVIGDSLAILKTEVPKEDPPEIIYLDPMFPERRKQALTKLEMRFIRDVVGEDLDADQLLTPALLRAKRRVVVKRPKGAAPLMNQSPNHTIDGQGCRFDVYWVSGGAGRA